MSIALASEQAPRTMDAWEAGDGYERYMGRWSRLVAPGFLEWLGVPAGGVWVDVGCGTGALTQAIAETSRPFAVCGVDQSAGFIEHAARLADDPTVQYEVSDAETLPFDDDIFDVAVSGLALNFLSDPVAAIVEQGRVVRADGLIAAYVWDYADGMRLLRRFWDVATAEEPSAFAADEALRFPLATRRGLQTTFDAAGLSEVDTTAIDGEVTFVDFDELWQPFLSGQGPAPSFVCGLSDTARERLRERFRASLPIRADGTIRLPVRAWAVCGRT